MPEVTDQELEEVYQQSAKLRNAYEAAKTEINALRDKVEELEDKLSIAMEALDVYTMSRMEMNFHGVKCFASVHPGPEAANTALGLIRGTMVSQSIEAGERDKPGYLADVDPSASVKMEPMANFVGEPPFIAESAKKMREAGKVFAVDEGKIVQDTRGVVQTTMDCGMAGTD